MTTAPGEGADPRKVAGEGGSAAAPLVSVAIVTWNRRGDLERLLERLDAQTIAGQMEIVVIDNGSTDDTRAMLEARQGRIPIRATWLGRNVGPAVGRNVAINAARGEFVTFIDSDAYPEQSDVLERQVARLGEAGANLCGASCIIYDDAACEKVWLVGGNFTPLGHFDVVRSRSRAADVEAQWLSTCFATYPAALLREVGGFDPHYGYGIEDADLGMRVRAAAAGRTAAGAGARFWIDQDRAAVHLMNDAGRARDHRHFHAVFCYFERYRHYLILRHEGWGGVARRWWWLLRHRLHLWYAYRMPLTLYQRWLAYGWYPALNLVAAPWWRVLQRRDYLRQARIVAAGSPSAPPPRDTVR
jgi:glycosyltransferase involved in cell wall biosynthesis